MTKISSSIDQKYNEVIFLHKILCELDCMSFSTSGVKIPDDFYFSELLDFSTLLT